MTVTEQQAFEAACGHNLLDGVKWLWSCGVNINVHANQERSFRKACEAGNLVIAQWLWSLRKGINIHARHEYSFRMACERGHLAVVQWLWSLQQEIDLSARDHAAFRKASDNQIADLLIAYQQNQSARAPQIRYLRHGGTRWIIGAECTPHVYRINSVPISCVDPTTEYQAQQVWDLVKHQKAAVAAQ